MSTTPGETKNIVDALRRALQGPVSSLASGGITSGGSFTLSLQPSSFQAPGGSVQSYQSTVDVASVGGFNGTVTLTEVDTLTAAGGAVAFLSATLTSVSTITVQVSSPSPSGDGLVPLNILVGASTPQGTYTVTVTGTSLNNGVSQTASAILTIVVGAGTTKCVNDKDCGTGCSCLNGVCDCLIDNTLLGCGPNVATGTGPNPCNIPKWTQLCSGEGVGPPFTDNGCCYCGPKKPGDCAQYTVACQAKYGSSSVSQYVCSAAGCGCFCTQPKPSSTPIQVSCPANVNACLSSTTPQAQNAISQFTVTNTDLNNAYNVNMTMTPVGLNCACCGAGPSLSTGGGYSIGPGGAQGTIITVPITCATSQCYQWNLKITVALALTNQVIQTFTCPFKVCSTTGPCFIVETECDSGGNCACAAPSWVSGITCDTHNCNANPTGAICASCTGTLNNSLCLFDFRVRSINGFAGNVTVSYSQSGVVACGPCPTTGIVAVVANASTSLGQWAGTVSLTCNDYDPVSRSNYEYAPKASVVVTATNPSLSSSASGFALLRCRNCPC